jgi:hypothetical protein
MKRLILIQNDAAGTGKSTLTHCLERYLNQYGVAHQVACLVEECDPLSDRIALLAESLNGDQFSDFLDQAPLSILEIETGLGHFFGEFYQSYGLEERLAAQGIQLSLVIPVGAESDTFESVVKAAEVYSDTAEYTIAHLVTGSYDDNTSSWDRSYAARVMDMFEAVELYMPEIGFQLEMELRAHHIEITEALAEPAAEDIFGRDFSNWLSRCMNQVDCARRYLFGDAFLPTAMPVNARPTKKSKRSRAHS